MKRLLFISPHLSTGGAPAYMLKKIELINDTYHVKVVEYSNLSGNDYTVHKDKITNLIGADNVHTLGDDKFQLLEIIDTFKPDIIHFEEIPEYFCDIKIAEKIYTKHDRDYFLMETTHDSSYNIDLKMFLPDKFVFVSKFSIEQYESFNIPMNILEYPIELQTRPNRDDALSALGLNSDMKHVLNVGLFTPRKNQAELIEMARVLDDKNIMFHFVGNQAINFKDYWEPLMNELPKNVKIWGERSDVDAFYSAMDLFYFASKGTVHDKETNPLVLKEALGWQMPILMYNLPVYVGMYKEDNQITFLTGDFLENINILLEKLSSENDSNSQILPENDIGGLSIDDFYITSTPNENKIYVKFKGTIIPDGYEKLYLTIHDNDTDIELMTTEFDITSKIWIVPGGLDVSKYFTHSTPDTRLLLKFHDINHDIIFQYTYNPDRTQDVDFDIDCAFDTDDNKFHFTYNGTKTIPGYISVRDADSLATIYYTEVTFRKDNTLWIIPIPKANFDFGNYDKFYAFRCDFFDKSGNLLSSEEIRLKDRMDEYTGPTFEDIPFDCIYINYDEFFNHNIYEKLGYDIKDCDTVIDIGANNGLFSEYIFRNGAKYVYAVEPIEKCMNNMKVHFKDRDNIKFITAGVDKVSGLKDIYFTNDNTSISSFNTIGRRYQGDSIKFDTVQIKTLSFADLISSNNIQGPISLVKIDIEGAEYDVFESMSDSDICLVEKFLIEWHYNDNDEVDVIIDRLIGLDYDVQIHEQPTGFKLARLADMGIIYATKKTLQQKLKFDFTFDADENKIHISHNMKTSKKYHVICKDIDSKVPIYNTEITFEPGVSYWLIPLPKDLFDFSDKKYFHGFSIDFYDGDKFIETNNLVIRSGDYSGPVFDNIKDDVVYHDFREIFIEGIYDKFNLDNLDVVIDIGANNGIFTEYVLRKGAQKVHAVEPNNDALESIDQRDDMRVFKWPFALDTITRERELYFIDGCTAVSSFNTKGDAYHGKHDIDSITVSTISYTYLLVSLGLVDKNISLVKMDIEGAEWDVLESISERQFLNIEKFLLEWHFSFDGEIDNVIKKFNDVGFICDVVETGKINNDDSYSERGYLLAYRDKDDTLNYFKERSKVNDDLKMTVVTKIKDMSKEFDFMIHSLSQQNFDRPIDLLVLDNGSTDDIKHKCKILKYDNINIIYKTLDKFVDYFKVACANVDAGILFFLDADDAIPSFTIDYIYQEFKNNNLDYFIGSCETFHHKNYNIIGEEISLTAEETDKGLPHTHHPLAVTVKYAEQILNKYEIEFTLAEDAEFIGYMDIAGGKYSISKDILYYYRKEFEQSITANHNNLKTQPIGYDWNTVFDLIDNKLLNLRPDNFVSNRVELYNTNPNIINTKFQDLVNSYFKTQLKTYTIASNYFFEGQEELKRAGLQTLIKSAIKHDINLQILGLEDEFDKYLYFLTNFLKYINKYLNDEDVVMLTDAYDDFYVTGSSEILQIYHDKFEGYLLVSGEHNCWPVTYDKYPSAPTDYAYINTGGFIGTVKLFKEVFIEAINAGVDNDQHAIHEVFIGKCQHLIKIDYWCEIFQTFESTKMEEFEIINDRLYNKNTKTFPCILHGNGHSGFQIYKEFKKLLMDK